MRRLSWILGGGSITVIAYTFLWFHLGGQLQDQIEKMALDLNAKGFEVTYKNLKLTGYPFALKIVAQNPRISHSELFNSWVDGEMVFAAYLWNPNEITSIAGGRHYTWVSGINSQPIDFEGEGFKVQFFALNPTEFKFSYDELEVLQNKELIVSAREITFTLLDNPKEEKDPPTLMDMELTLEDLSGPFLQDQPLGESIDAITLKATLRGSFSGDTLKSKVKSWYESGGTLDMAQLALNWGPLKMDSEGTATVDENLQPMAAFSAKLDGVNEMLNALVSAGLIKKQAANIAKLGLAFLSEPTDDETTSNQHQVSITVQDGQLSIGPVSVGNVARIAWDD